MYYAHTVKPLSPLSLSDLVHSIDTTILEIMAIWDIEFRTINKVIEWISVGGKHDF
jgi:hypothetical protein